MADVQALASALVDRFGARDAASRLDTSRQHLQRVVSGERVASPDLAARIETLTESLAAVPVAKPQPVGPIAGGPVMPELRATIQRIDEALAHPDTAATARASLLRVRADTLHRLAELQGEGELTPAQIMKSSAWAQIRAALDRVAEQYPEAGRAFAEALGVFES